jgi:Domain of unknown function (DUF3846)
MLAAIKHPGGIWRCLDIEPTLENIRQTVGGDIEMVPNFHTEAVMYCNENGKNLGLAPNFYVLSNSIDCAIPIDCIVGTVIMFGPNDGNGNETDLTVDLFNRTTASVREYNAKQNP